MNEIVWVSNECPFPANSGGRLLTWKRISYLSKQYKVHLFSIIDDSKECNYLNEILKVCESAHFYKKRKSFKILIKSIFRPYSVVNRYCKTMQKDIEEVCIQKKITYVIVDFPQMLYNFNKDFFNSYRVIVNQHNTEFLTLKNIGDSYNNFIKRLVYRYTAFRLKKYERKIYKNNIYLYTFVSDSDKESFESNYNLNNTLLLPIGTEIAPVENSSIKENNIIFVGKMSYQPNIEGAIWFVNNVFNLIKKEVPDAKFYLVGKEPAKKLMDKASKDIIVTGAVESVEEYYNLAKCVVLPIFSGGGVKVKLLEALGHGKVVIGTVKSCEGTDFIHQEHLLCTDDAVAFSKYCVEVLKDLSQYNYLSDNALKKVKQEYSWENIMIKLLNKME